MRIFNVGEDKSLMNVSNVGEDKSSNIYNSSVLVISPNTLYVLCRRI